MTIRAFYNEIDPFACAWLSNLMDAGQITPGVICDKSIADVTPGDVAGFERVHWFAGIAGWDLALNLAGWGDGLVWSGSAPCQPFSSAGKGAGFNDTRHLWPTWFRLIRECKPPVVFGEQVASADGLSWFDHVSTDLEAEGYAVGAADLCAAGVGAPHIRQRLFFVGESESQRYQGGGGNGAGLVSDRQREATGRHAAIPGGYGGVADAERRPTERRGHDMGSAPRAPEGAAQKRQRLWADAGDGGNARRLASSGSPERWSLTERRADEQHGHDAGREEAPGGHRMDRPWSDPVWLPCRDGKARPTQPGIFPLAHGVPNRVGTLRGAGNAICPEAAAEFIQAYREAVSA